MADISSYLTKISTAKYGEEVRGSIHDAIEKINTEMGNVTVTATDSEVAEMLDEVFE